ncbi:MAG: ribosome silencing factor [Oscillospiraceae bacterium]
MTQEKLLESIVKILDRKKAQDIKVIKISDLTILADYFVIANGSSTTQTKSLADEVEFQLSQQGVEPTRTEGYSTASWIILDYSDIIVHIFHKDAREYYQLERLWADGQEVDISNLINED